MQLQAVFIACFLVACSQAQLAQPPVTAPPATPPTGTNPTPDPSSVDPNAQKPDPNYQAPPATPGPGLPPPPQVPGGPKPIPVPLSCNYSFMPLSPAEMISLANNTSIEKTSKEYSNNKTSAFCKPTPDNFTVGICEINSCSITFQCTSCTELIYSEKDPNPKLGTNKLPTATCTESYTLPPLSDVNGTMCGTAGGLWSCASCTNPNYCTQCYSSQDPAFANQGGNQGGNPAAPPVPANPNSAATTQANVADSQNNPSPTQPIANSSTSGTPALPANQPDPSVQNTNQITNPPPNAAAAA
ncbi:hypothetical protein O181_065381 [Austropuccinia psidii MF-1]|uniref:RanBP2-type domain-containing protein n=1 Tax=Austropuccinia psidii MF-1 TaxID=1389203 RepID=A0A9Q3EVI6_9BASI|nr:hypothetical protein [Austropuccinia psidii MF-1]